MAKLRMLSFVYRGQKVHLRVDPSGVGVLVVAARRSAYLNRTGTFFAESFLRGEPPEKVAKSASKRFKGISAEKALEDYREFAKRLKAFLEAEEVCPITDLGFSRVDPLSVKTTAPFRMDLALTYRCNNACIHCYSGSPAEVKPELDAKRWKAVLRKIVGLGVPNVVFTGGEPTLRGDLVELVAEAQRLGLVAGLVTNGRRLADRSYAESLVRAGLDYAQVTLESHRPEVHEKITQVPGSWRETVEGIRNLADLGIYVDVNATLSTLNVGDVRGLVELAAELGADAVSANRLIYSGRGLEVREWFEPTPEQTLKALEEMVDAAAEHDMEFRWYGVTRYCELNPLGHQLGVKFCSACSITMAVEPDGTVIPCQSYYQPLGNILKDSWDSVWNHDLCRGIRSRAFAGGACLSCPFYRACGGGCPLEAEVRPYPESPPDVG